MEQTADEEERDASEPRAWSRIKHRILEKYIDAYLNKRGSSHPKIYYVDGFAGSGRFVSGASIQEGSPIRLARLAQRILDEDRTYRLICINTERSPRRCKRLQAAVAEFSPEIVHVLCGTFASRLDDILAMMGRAPAVFFLDPFGVVGIAPHELLPILKRHDTEILLNLNTRVLHRLAGSATSGAKAAQRKVNLISAVLGDAIGDPLPEWLQQRNTLDSSAWQEWAVNRYRNQLVTLSPSLKYSMAYPVRERHLGGVKYYLVFASRRLDAFPFLTDFICTEEDDQRLQAELEARAPGQLSLFRPAYEAERDNRMQSLAEEIHAYGLEHQRCSRKEIIEHFSLLYLGQFMQKHYRRLLNDLETEGRLKFAPGKGLDYLPITFN